MRLAILVAAFGLVSALPVTAPIFAPAAQAQATTMTMEEQTLQAQLVSLAQAGDNDGIKALIRAKIAQGKGAMVAKVAKSIASMGAQLAGSDATSAAALVNAAVLIASDPSVSDADPTVGSEVGASAASAVATLNQTGDVTQASSIQVAISTSGNNAVQIGYNNQQSTGSTQPVRVVSGMQQGGNNRQQQNNPPTRPDPDQSEPPVVVEPNPDQSGSPT